MADDFKAANKLMGKVRKNLSITDAEQRIVDYHDETIRSNKVGKDTQGRPITVYSTGIKIPNGEPNAGKFVSVPGYNRDEKKIMNEGEAYDYWKDEIHKNLWPIYETGKQLNDRSKAIHGIMDEDYNSASKSVQQW